MLPILTILACSMRQALNSFKESTILFIRDDPYATYKLLKPEFEKRGYTYSEETKNGLFYVCFTSQDGKTWRFRGSRIGYPFTSKQMKELSVHKEIAYEYVEKLGVSVPFTRYVRSTDMIDATEAQALVEKYGKLIVKPANSSLSRGLSLNITSPEALNQAIDYGREFKKNVLIQEQLEGEEIRFIIISGKVKAALLRQTARVIGDGISTVAELIKAENETRKTLAFPMISYPQLTEKMIAPELFTDNTVLAKGEVKELNRATMIKNGCSVYDVLDQLHPSYLALVESMVSELDTNFMAADLFLKNYKAEKTDDNYWFIEFNTSPVLKLCYGCRDGKMFDVIPPLVTAIDQWLHPSQPAL